MRYVIPFCGNKKITSRPCFYYHLGRCPGVCFGAVTLEKYSETLKAVGRFLKGDFANIQKNLKGQMKIAARQKKFERAAKLRDQVFALEKMLERQKIMSTKRESFDTVSVFSAGSLAAVNLFQIREGRLIGKENFILENAKDKDTDEILRSFLTRYYLETYDIPDQINIPHLTPSLSQLGEGAQRADEVRDFKKKKSFITDINQLGKILSNKSGKNIKFLSPSRGRKRKLLKLGETNARDFLEKSSQNQAKEQAQLTRALFELQNKLRLPALPLRIEAYDISNIQGTLPTGSMVVFENGKPKKTDYKRFAIKSLSTPNDVGMMREVLERRFGHTINEKNNAPLPPLKLRGGEGELSWRRPDLIVVDGGRAQLNTALSVLKSKKLKIPVMGLAKRLEEIYLPQLKSPLLLPANSAALHLLQRVRDEAHRFAIAYHRKKRTKKMLE
ncbi:MAG: excinuclease ABC subunit UvrC [bacterium]|nr:excinuclease ABC subunit UvrC [bacterium]